MISTAALLVPYLDKKSVKIWPANKNLGANCFLFFILIFGLVCLSSCFYSQLSIAFQPPCTEPKQTAQVSDSLTFSDF